MIYNLEGLLSVNSPAGVFRQQLKHRLIQPVILLYIDMMAQRAPQSKVYIDVKIDLGLVENILLRITSGSSSCRGIGQR